MEELNVIKNSWKEERSSLNKDFLKIVNDAQNLTEKLNNQLKHCEKLISNCKENGTEYFRKKFFDMNQPVNVSIKEYNIRIDSRIKSIKQKKKYLDFFQFLIALLTASISFYKIIEIFSPSLNKNLLSNIIVFCFTTVSAIIFSNLLFHSKSTYKRKIKEIYDYEIDRLIKSVREEFNKGKDDITKYLREKNHSLRTNLNNEYDAIINNCEKAKNDLIPMLNEQIKAASQFSKRIFEKIITSSFQIRSKIQEVTINQLNSSCEENEENLLQKLSDLVDFLSKGYINKLEEYTKTFKNIAKEILALNVKISRLK